MTTTHMDTSEKTRLLKQIRDEVVACKKCSLYATRKLPVVGVGSHDAHIMFIGEAPGATEDATGIPFCGKAGHILDEVIESVGLKREDVYPAKSSEAGAKQFGGVYICNVLKCRPPGNRDPNPTEKLACVDYLKRQIEIIQPKIICAMGNHAAGFIFEQFGLSDKLVGISKLHGQVFDSPSFSYPVKIVSLYHPAVATYNPRMKEVLLEDIKVLKEFIV
ncbi:MAG: uracil-DNA glycosylase [Patescibacteria group bacterium]|nr:uracil-DNA glycosylase [Patescibacteria group bacterium]